jgi:hypothetical protein
LGVFAVVVNLEMYNYDHGVEASQVDFIPPSEIGIKLAAFGLARLEGNAKALPCSIIVIY